MRSQYTDDEILAVAKTIIEERRRAYRERVRINKENKRLKRLANQARTKLVDKLTIIFQGNKTAKKSYKKELKDKYYNMSDENVIKVWEESKNKIQKDFYQAITNRD